MSILRVGTAPCIDRCSDWQAAIPAKSSTPGFGRLRHRGYRELSIDHAPQTGSWPHLQRQRRAGGVVHSGIAARSQESAEQGQTARRPQEAIVKGESLPRLVFIIGLVRSAVKLGQIYLFWQDRATARSSSPCAGRR
jgi:hypothetical protein